MLAPAKLNLALHVTGQRDDGYHLLHSLVAFADVGDEVCIYTSSQDQLTVDGPYANTVPPLDKNTLGAALRLARAWGLATDPVHIELTKNLPTASGIGGGSADAAALLRLLVGKALTDDQLRQTVELGADVPMCVVGQSALVEGIGETISPVSLPEAHVVLVNPSVEVSTPAIFKALASKTNPPMLSWDVPKTFSDLTDYLQQSRNDLMAPAIDQAPNIQACLDALSAAPIARMSGSGATCFALCETQEDAEELSKSVSDSNPDWWVRAGRLL